MPTYEYCCPSCGNIREEIHSIKATPRFYCHLCAIGGGSKFLLKRMISYNATGFVIKGGTSSMGWKENRYRQKKNADLGLKQIERYGSGPRLQPNVAGMEVDSWSDAAKVAKEAGMNTASYEPLIRKDKHTSTDSNVDDRKWKKAKDGKDRA